MKLFIIALIAVAQLLAFGEAEERHYSPFTEVTSGTCESDGSNMIPNANLCKTLLMSRRIMAARQSVFITFSPNRSDLPRGCTINSEEVGYYNPESSGGDCNATYPCLCMDTAGPYYVRVTDLSSTCSDHNSRYSEITNPFECQEVSRNIFNFSPALTSNDKFRNCYYENGKLYYGVGNSNHLCSNGTVCICKAFGGLVMTPTTPPVPTVPSVEDLGPYTCDKASDSVKDTNKRFMITCPNSPCTSGVIWGSNPYTLDSPSCRACIHTGIIEADGSGDRRCILAFKDYISTVFLNTTANNVSSVFYDGWSSAYTVHKPSTLPPTTKQPAGSPLSVPTTSAPTTIVRPSTAPTSTPITLAPSSVPATPEPTSAPSHAPTTLTPSSVSTTAAPTTLEPSSAATTLMSTSAPTALTPSSAATTLTPTSAPTTLTPSSAAMTLTPTSTPTTLATSSAPTTLAPTLMPTKSPTQQSELMFIQGSLIQTTVPRSDLWFLLLSLSFFFVLTIVIIRCLWRARQSQQNDATATLPGNKKTVSYRHFLLTSI